MATIDDVVKVLNDYLLNRRIVVMGKEYIPFPVPLTNERAEKIINNVIINTVLEQLNSQEVK